MGADQVRHRLLGDRYQLMSPFRRDVAGIIWRAHDLRLKRDVGIKEVHPPFGVDRPDLAAVRWQALREARSAARLSHPAIITVHDLLEDKGRVWIVTELLQGLTLMETLRHLGRLPVHWAAWVGFQLLAGVRHAHAAGVVHGDIRPCNVLLTEDRVVLTDFGIAALSHDILAPAPAVPAAYLAPERRRGGALTQQADMWSFGATLHYAVEGQPPVPDDAGDTFAPAPSDPFAPPSGDALAADGDILASDADRTGSAWTGSTSAGTSWTGSGSTGTAWTGSSPTGTAGSTSAGTSWTGSGSTGTAWSGSSSAGSAGSTEITGGAAGMSLAGPLREVLCGLLREDPAERLTGEEAVRLLTDVLHREGIAAVPTGRRDWLTPHVH